MTASRRAPRRTSEPPSPPGPGLNLPAPVALPGHIRPEAGSHCSDPFDDPEWRFGIDWDGCRALLFIGDGGAVKIQGETLRDITAGFPELAGAAEAFKGAGSVLDGVIAVLDPEGRPDLAALGHRLALGAAGAAELPAVFLATDLLYLNGVPITRRALDRRIAALTALDPASATLQLPEFVRGEGRALATAASRRGLATIVARHGRAPYRPGFVSPHRLLIALERRTSCVVVGMVRRAAGWAERRLVLAEYAEGGRLVAAGEVAASPVPAVAEWLDRYPLTRVESPPVAGVETRAGMEWFLPQLTATVGYSGRAGDATLVAPTLVAIRDDLDPAGCVQRGPSPPPATAAAAFRPTVIPSLPLSSN